LVGGARTSASSWNCCRYRAKKASYRRPTRAGRCSGQTGGRGEERGAVCALPGLIAGTLRRRSERRMQGRDEAYVDFVGVKFAILRGRRRWHALSGWQPLWSLEDLEEIAWGEGRRHEEGRAGKLNATSRLASRCGLRCDVHFCRRLARRGSARVDGSSMLDATSSPATWPRAFAEDTSPRGSPRACSSTLASPTARPAKASRRSSCRTPRSPPRRPCPPATCRVEGVVTPSIRFEVRLADWLVAP